MVDTVRIHATLSSKQPRKRNGRKERENKKIEQQQFSKSKDWLDRFQFGSQYPLAFDLSTDNLVLVLGLVVQGMVGKKTITIPCKRNERPGHRLVVQGGQAKVKYQPKEIKRQKEKPNRLENKEFGDQVMNVARQPNGTDCCCRSEEIKTQKGRLDRIEWD